MSTPAELQELLQEQKSRIARMRFRQEEDELGEQLLALAQLHGMLEEHAAAAETYAEALPFLRKQKQHSEQGEALLGQGVATLHQGNTREALLLIADAVACYREGKDELGEAGCHAAAAEVCRSLGDDETAPGGLRAGPGALPQGARPRPRGARAGGPGDLAMAAADYAQALARFEEALPLAQEAKDDALVGQCAMLLGESAGLMGDHATARTALELALPHYARVGPKALEARAAWDLGLSLYYLGALSESEATLQQAKAAYAAVGHADEVDAHRAGAGQRCGPRPRRRGPDLRSARAARAGGRSPRGPLSGSASCTPSSRTSPRSGLPGMRK